MFTKIGLLLIGALALLIVVIIIGRWTKLLVFDLRATLFSVLGAIGALIYIYWKSRPT